MTRSSSKWCGRVNSLISTFNYCYDNFTRLGAECWLCAALHHPDRKPTFFFFFGKTFSICWAVVIMHHCDWHRSCKMMRPGLWQTQSEFINHCAFWFIFVYRVHASKTYLFARVVALDWVKTGPGVTFFFPQLGKHSHGCPTAAAALSPCTWNELIQPQNERDCQRHTWNCWN